MSRFNLRSRKSLKLSSQSQCEQCQRPFFARDDDDSDNENKALCNECDASMTAKKAAENKKQPSRTIAKRIKLEKSDPDFNVNDCIEPVQFLQNGKL